MALGYAIGGFQQQYGEQYGPLFTRYEYRQDVTKEPLQADWLTNYPSFSLNNFSVRPQASWAAAAL